MLGGARGTTDLHDVVLLLLGTGMRSEALALEWTDVDLDADIPCVRVAATLVEPRRDAATGQVFVTGLRRQPTTKTGAPHSIAVPGAAVQMLNRRRAGVLTEPERQPAFPLGVQQPAGAQPVQGLRGLRSSGDRLPRRLALAW